MTVPRAGEHVFHIAEGRDWDEARRLGVYRCPSLESEGFIHCSTAAQWPRVLEERFSGATGLVLLGIDLDRFPAEVRWENLEGGSELFPHLYGALPVSAVISAQALST